MKPFLTGGETEGGAALGRGEGPIGGDIALGGGNAGSAGGGLTICGASCFAAP